MEPEIRSGGSVEPFLRKMRSFPVAAWERAMNALALTVLPTGYIVFCDP